MINCSRTKQTKPVNIIIVSTPDVGKAVALAALLLIKEETPIYPVVFPQEEVSEGSIEEVVIQIHKGFHEELLRIPVIKELFLLDEQNIVNSQKEILKPALQTGNTQKFNNKKTMHPP